jgi:hypothetical protein
VQRRPQHREAEDHQRIARLQGRRISTQSGVQLPIKLLLFIRRDHYTGIFGPN